MRSNESISGISWLVDKTLKKIADHFDGVFFVVHVKRTEMEFEIGVQPKIPCDRVGLHCTWCTDFGGKQRTPSPGFQSYCGTVCI